MDLKVENLMKATLETYQALSFNFKECERLATEAKRVEELFEVHRQIWKVCSDIHVVLRLTGEVHHGIFKTLLFDAQRLSDEVRLQIQAERSVNTEEKFYVPAGEARGV